MKEGLTKWLLIICGSFVMLSGYSQPIPKSDSLELVLQITKKQKGSTGILVEPCLCFSLLCCNIDI